MGKYSRSLTKIRDPYAYIALQVIHQAFHEIRCYYYQRGREEEIQSGYEAIKWIIKMEGNFRLYSGVVAHIPVEKFHQLCLEKINTIKKEAYERQQQKG